MKYKIVYEMDGEYVGESEESYTWEQAMKIARSLSFDSDSSGLQMTIEVADED